MRITNAMLTGRALQNLQANYAGLARVQAQVSSGRRLNRPSDDPAQVRTAVKLRDTLNAIDQHLRNVDTAERLTDTADTALGSAGDVLQRARELAIQAANGTASSSDRQKIAVEVEQLGEALVALANARSGEDYIFSGLRTRTAPYASVSSVYAGDGGALQARIAPGVTVNASVPGNEAFGAALSALDQLGTALAAGLPPDAGVIDALDTGLDSLLVARSRIGAVANRLEGSRTFLEDGRMSAISILSTLEDADMAAVISEAATRQAVYEAALSVNAKILRRSLIDEL